MGKGNDQLVRTVPGTDVGGHDTAGVDGKERTERSGELLGTPDLTPDVKRQSAKARELEERKSDYVREEVDRANREDLPKLGGNVEDGWKPGDDKGKRTPAAPARAPAPTTPANPDK
jgi:hypothetical protein